MSLGLPLYKVQWDAEDGCYRVLEVNTGSRPGTGQPRYLALGWMRFASEAAAWEHIENRRVA